MSVCSFGSEQIDTYWTLFSHHLERFERETQIISAEDLRKHLKDARKQLWAFHDGDGIAGVAVTEIYQTLRGPICTIWAACGTETETGQIEQIMFHVEQWARGMHCVALEIRGRRGWTRRLPNFTQTGVILEKAL
jgi:hypothetical protein